MRPSAQLQATIELLDEITETGYPADRLMSQYFKQRRYIGSKDKAAISENLYTVLRNRLSFEFLLERADLSLNSRVLVALMAQLKGEDIYDLFDGDRYSPRRLTANQLEKFKNLDSNLDNASLHVKLNVPAWLADKLSEALGDRFEQEMFATNQRATTDIRVNTLKSTVDQVQHVLANSGHITSKTILSSLGLRFEDRVSLFGIDSFKEGWFEVQDEGSQLLAQLTGVKPGDRVVDFCAGAGGKTLALAAMMNNKGAIYACDVHDKRLNQATKRAKRAGVHNVRTHVLSSEKDKWVKQHAAKADVVLIDAPCTGTGTWRRNPDSRWNLTQENLDNLVALQQSILQSASRLVKSGGRLFYATCSLLKEENEEQINRFLKANTEFSYSELMIDKSIESNLDKVIYQHRGDAIAELRTMPALSGTDGFYVCALERVNVVESS